MKPGAWLLSNIQPALSFAAWSGEVGEGGLKGGGGSRVLLSSHRNGNSPVGWLSPQRRRGEPHIPDRDISFTKHFPPLHLKLQHNHTQGRCTMKWNRAQDPEERTQSCVYWNEDHFLPGDAPCLEYENPGQQLIIPTHVTVQCKTETYGVFCKCRVWGFNVNVGSSEGHCQDRPLAHCNPWR